MPEVIEEVTPLTISLDFEVKVEDLQDIFSTASIYIYYWCHVSSRTKNMGKLIILDDDTERLPENKEDYVTFEVTPEFILLGIKRLLSREVKVNQEIHGWLFSAITTADMGMIDVTVADCIMQAACFNDIVYG